MRAVALESVPSTPAVTDVSTPSPGAEELLIKVAVASLNGIDIATAAGHTQGIKKLRFPLILGQDFAGTVEALGEDTDGFAVGDAVFGVVLKPYLGGGTLAQYVTVPADRGVTHIPVGMASADAAALAVAGATAVTSLDTLGVAAGQTVLISGAAGGVGSLAEQVAVGALRVPVTETYPLEQATEAFAAFSGGAPGKIVISCA